MTTKTASKTMERQFYIVLDGKGREDGSMFVTSQHLPYFSAVLPSGEWDDVIGHLKRFLQANVGKVKSIQVIHDGSELFPHNNEQAFVPPPAYVIAKVDNKNVCSVRSGAPVGG